MKEISIKVNIEKFPFPVSVDVKSDFGPGQISLKSITPETLSELCHQFRADVFKEAGKTDPDTVFLKR